MVLIMGSEVGDADDADVDGAVGMGHVIGASSPLNGAERNKTKYRIPHIRR